MSQIIAHSKPVFHSLFQSVPIESLSPTFQELLRSFPEVFTSEILHPIPENPSGNDFDDAIFPHQKKVFGNKPFHFQNQQQPISQQIAPTFPSKTQSSDNYNSFNYKARSMIRTPFSSSGYSTDLGERVWFYIDEQNEIQGPFTTLEMDSWFEKGFLFDELKICHSLTNKFFPLYDLFVTEKGVKSLTNIEIEPFQKIDKVMKKRGSDIVHRDQFSSQNEAKMFETLQSAITQQTGLLPDPNQIMERNIKQFNVIYPNMGNNNELPQNPKNVYMAPINPNFNPLLSQQGNKPTLSKSEQPSQKNPTFQNNNFNNMPLNNMLKTPSETKIESKTEKVEQFNKEAKPVFINYKAEKVSQSKPQEKQIEKKESKNEVEIPQIKPTEEPKKKTKPEYVKVYEPKKIAPPAPEKELIEEHSKPKIEERKVFEKENFEYVKNEKLLKDFKHNKGNIDKDKYFIVYQAKQENQAEVHEHERKLSQGKEDVNKKEKKTKKKNRKMHNSNSPEQKEGGEKTEEVKFKFNTHFQKENKNTNKPSKPAYVKEYVLKK